MRPSMLAALLLAASFIAIAGREEFEGRPIAAVQFDPSQQPFAADELRDLVLPIKAGNIYRATDVRAAIQSLYATGRYTDVQVDANPAPEGIVVRFITEKRLFVGSVAVSGAAEPPNAGQLATASKLQLGDAFTPTDLPQARDNILERLRANGLFNAKLSDSTSVEPRIDQIDIDFQIDPGKRAQFAGLKIEGDPQRQVDAVLRSTRWKRFLFGWRAMTESRLQSGIENVRAYYQKSNHLLARVQLAKIDYNQETNTVIPTVSITAGPVVKVQAAGARLSKGKLRSLLPIYQERSVDTSLLIEGRRNLIAYFQSKGYFDVVVDYDVLPEEKGVETIEYVIDRDGRHKLVAIDITGNHYFDSQTIRERLYIQPASFLRFRHGRYSERDLARDIGAVQELYRSNGFRDVKVESSTTDDYNGKTGDIAVQLKVTEGPQWFVSKLEFDGASVADTAHLLGILHSTDGQPFSEYNIATDRDTVLSYYYNNGYPQAQFDWSQSSAGEQQVALRFQVTPGPRRFVRDYVLNGLDTTNPRLATSRVTLKPGDPLSQIEIAETQRRLYDLGIFAKVETAIQNPEGVEESKYVLYQVEEARRYSVNFGVGAEIGRIGGGVTTFDAPAGTGSFAPRVSVGVSRLNFLGLAHTVSLQTRFSTLQQRGLLSYFAPQFTGRENLNLTFTALYDNSYDVRTFAARRLEGSIQLGQKLSRANAVQYRFTYRDVYVDPNSVKITPQLIPLLSQSVRVGQLGASFIQDRRDDPVDPHRGIFNTIDVGLSLKQFGSETEFWRLNTRNATYHRINRDLTFARSTSFGVIHPLGGETVDVIPLPERFFSGGATSLRAFPENQAGPRDPLTGFPLGGTALLMNSLELRFPLIGDDIGGVLFHDMGNVFNRVQDITFRATQRSLANFNYMVHGIGFGIRYRTPIGPIRVDLSLSPNSPRFRGFEGSRDELLTCSAPGSVVTCPVTNQRISIFQFHFSLGQAF